MEKITRIIGFKTPRPEGWDVMTADEKYTSEREAVVTHRRGFWGGPTAATLARSIGLTGPVKVKHVIMDYSGKGRHRVMSEFEVTA